MEESKIEEISSAIGKYLKSYESILMIRGIGVLPNLKRPRVLYASVFNPDMTIVSLQKDIEIRLEKLGFKPEKRNYRPHITLQRPKKVEREAFKEMLVKYKEFEIGMMPEFKIDLVESELTREGPVYKIVDV